MKKLISSIYYPPRKKNSHSLKDLYSQNNHITYYSLARHALKTGLTSLGIKKGDSVLVPSLICRDVLAPFNELGVKVLFFKLDQNLNLSKVDELPPANAIMAIHYFGLETDLSPYFDYCKAHNAFLIEDNAHGLFSRSANNNLLGTSGDIGIISARKTLPIQNGAILLQSLKYKKVDQVQFDNYVSKNLMLKNKLRPFVAFFGIGFLLKITKLKRLLRKWKTGNELPISEDSDETQIPLAANPIDIEGVLAEIDLDSEIKRRRELFVVLKNYLNTVPVRPLRENLGKNEVPYSYPFYCNPTLAKEVAHKLESVGLEVVNWPSLPKKVLESQPPEFYSSLYFVKFLW